MARGDCNITNICIPTRRIIYAAGFTPPPPGCVFPDGSFAQGGEICDWEYRVRYDVDPALVPSDQSDFPLVVLFDEVATDLSPTNAATFWNEISPANIRVTSVDGTTELPHYTHAIDNMNETGYMTVLVPVVSGSVATSIFIYFANPAATEYAVGHALGRNATFANYEAIWDFEQDPSGASPQLTDLTGNGWNGTVGVGAGTGTTGIVTKVAGKIGSAWNFGNKMMVTSGSVTHPDVFNYSMGGWISMTTAGGRGLFGASLAGASNRRFAVYKDASNVAISTTPSVAGGLATGSTAINTGLWVSLTASTIRGAVNGAKIYVNGVLDGQGDTLNWSLVAPATWTMAHYNNASGVPSTSNFDMEGKLSLVWYRRLIALSADYITTEHNNQNAPGTFATFTNFLANV